MISKLTFISILLSFGVAHATEKFESVQDIKVSAGSNGTQVLYSDAVSCTLRHDKKSYDRKINLNSAFDVISFKNEFRTLEFHEMLDMFSSLLDIDLSGRINTIQELIVFSEKEFGISLSTSPRHVFIFKLKSEKTESVYDLVCESAQDFPEENILSLLVEKGKIAPVKDL